MKIILQETHHKKKSDRWKLEESKKREISLEHYKKMTCFEGRDFFKNFGGVERCYCDRTENGYRTSKLVCVSPSGDEKFVFKFKFV